VWTTATSDQCRTASFAAAQAMSRPCGRLPASCAALPVPSTACARTATHAGSRNSKRQDFPATEGRQPLHTPPLSPQASRHTKPRRHLPAPTPHSQHSHRTHPCRIASLVERIASIRSSGPIHAPLVALSQLGRSADAHSKPTARTGDRTQGSPRSSNRSAPRKAPTDPTPLPSHQLLLYSLSAFLVPPTSLVGACNRPRGKVGAGPKDPSIECAHHSLQALHQARARHQPDGAP